MPSPFVQSLAPLRRAWPILRWVLLAVVLAFVGYEFARQLRQLDVSQLHLRPTYVALSAAAAVGVFCVMTVGYRLLLRWSFGLTIPWTTMAAATWVPQLGKYVPGKVAAVAASVGLLRKAGVPAALGLACYVILDGSTVTTGLCLSAPLLTAPDLAEHVPGAPYVAGALVLAGLAVFTPAVFNRIVALGLRLTGRQPLPRQLRLLDYLTPIVSALIQWSLCGLALWAMTSAIAPEPLPISAWPQCVSVAGLAITVSYLAIFAPGGAGVREGIYFIGLAAFGVPEELAVTVALLMRVQSITVEVFLATMGLLFMRRSRVNSVEPCPMTSDRTTPDRTTPGPETTRPSSAG